MWLMGVEARGSRLMGLSSILRRRLGCVCWEYWAVVLLNLFFFGIQDRLLVYRFGGSLHLG